ncbi:MAG: 5'-methylthioadenosine phosphorylase [Robiginitomaculum sp.]|nr:MAG: 5'-methylthioadenosine phosphorylase [Robiginitomaculum sp.]
MVSAIIGGTGIYALSDMGLQKETVKTPYGDVILERNDEIIFINRHAPKHSIPPHKVNYRANIKALEMLGVKRICGTFAVGSINKDFELAVPVILNDFIDFSSGRDHSFFDTIDNAVGHAEMSMPFCPVLSDALHAQAKSIGMKVRRGGVYASVNGPRFETPAEIRAYRMLGADVVGMTLCPELPLALELGMSYAGLAFSINWGAGMTDTIEFVGEGVETVKADMLRVMLGALANTKDAQCTPVKLL